MMEGYTQRSERTHVHLTDLSEIKCSQMIYAHISNESSLLLATGEESIQTAAGGNVSDTATSNFTTCQHSHATFLTFIGSSLVGGNYDTYADDNYNDPNTASGLNQEGELFQDVLHTTSQRIPTLSGVAQKIA